MSEQESTAGPGGHRPDPDGPAPRPEITTTLAEFVAIACLRGWCHESRICPICTAYRHDTDEDEVARLRAVEQRAINVHATGARDAVLSMPRYILTGETNG